MHDLITAAHQPQKQNSSGRGSQKPIDTHQSSSVQQTPALRLFANNAVDWMPGGPQKADEADELPPWKRLFHEKQHQQHQAKQEEHEQQQQEQEQQQQQEEPLSELQEQLLLCYRKTFIVAGFGLAGSTWRWNTGTKHKRKEVFLPPRAQALPDAVVQRWKQKQQFQDAVRTIGRQSLYITGIAGLYFGLELGVGLLRDKQDDWANTAAAGAVAGGFLGARVPSSMRSRTTAVGALVGGMLGAASGWTQQQLLSLIPQQEQQQQQQQQQEQRQGDKP